MNKKLEAAAKESAKHYFLNVANTTKHRTDDGLSFRDDYVPSITATWNTYDYAFKSGAAYGRKEALMEAIAEFEEKEKLGKPYSWTYHLCINELKQLLSKE